MLSRRQLPRGKRLRAPARLCQAVQHVQVDSGAHGRRHRKHMLIWRKAQRCQPTAGKAGIAGLRCGECGQLAAARTTLLQRYDTASGSYP
jgi:hypothetical protein